MWHIFYASRNKNITMNEKEIYSYIKDLCVEYGCDVHIKCEFNYAILGVEHSLYGYGEGNAKGHLREIMRKLREVYNITDVHYLNYGSHGFGDELQMVLVIHEQK